MKLILTLGGLSMNNKKKNKEAMKQIDGIDW